MDLVLALVLVCLSVIIVLQALLAMISILLLSSTIRRGRSKPRRMVVEGFRLMRSGGYF